MPALRPITADDKDRLLRFHARLSAESRYRRFHGAKGTLSRTELAYLTEVDDRTHVAIVAERDDGELAAVARVVCAGPGEAEVAVVVADDARGHHYGLAVTRAALERHARRAGGSVVACVQADNDAALHLFCDRLGGRREAVAHGVVTVRLQDPARA